MAFAYCPDCAARIYLNNKPKLGQTLACYCCEAELQIAHLNPLEIEEAEEITDEDRELERV